MMTATVPVKKLRGPYKKDNFDWDIIDHHFERSVTRAGQLKLVGRKETLHEGFTYVNPMKLANGSVRMRCQQRTYKGGRKCKASIRVNADGIRYIDLKGWHYHISGVRIIAPKEEVKANQVHSQINSTVMI